MATPSTLVADRYRLLKMLGAGGMGVVWQAWDERLRRDVALKMLRTQPDLGEREREVATNRAMREARITAGLHHPHAVTVFDVVEYEGQPCIVMQFVESTPLATLLREHGTLTPRETARIGAQVSSALAAAHRLRIVHRDVKPGNILVTEDGSALISDFGISHALGDASITATGMMHGTPAYLAPEVARGGESSFASDVFSLGSTLYTMLEGTPPFGAETNAIALLHKVASGRYPAPTHADGLAPLLREMLSADPKDRPDMISVTSRLSVMYDGTQVAGASALPTVPLAASAAIGTDASPSRTDAARPSDTSDTDTLRAAVADLERSEEPSAEAESAAGSTATTERFAAAAAAPSLSWLTQHQPEPSTSGATAAPPPLPATEVAPRTEPRRRRPVGALVGVILLAAVLVLGALVWAAGVRPSEQDASAPVDTGAGATPAETQTPAAETPSPEPDPTPQTSTPAPPAEQAPAPQPPTAEERAVEAVANYYAIMPGDRDTAWNLMTADYQVNHVGGRDAYDDFWGGISAVEIAGVTATGPEQVEATLTYHFTDGSVVQEQTAYRLVDEGGVLKIAATTVLSSVEL